MFFLRSPSMRRSTLWILILILTISCSSPSSPQVDLTPLPPPVFDPVFPDNLPTPTPFLPEDSPDPYLAVSTPQVAPTYTPYPTKYVLPQEGSAAAQVIPSAGNNSSINNPLTGLPVSDPAMLGRRPIAIKIGNAPRYVRPQSGLSLADVAYEYYIEWGQTRFVALFYGNDAERVGPVRSGRFFDEHIARMYHSYLFFKGADDRAMTYFRTLDISDFLIIAGIGTCPPFFMSPYQRDAYNNVFFDTTKWSACAERRNLDNSPQAISGGFFSVEAPQSLLNVTRIYSSYSIYSYNYWEYDPAANNYIRYQDVSDAGSGKPESYAPLTDDLTKLPVAAENVVVLFIPHIYANTYNAEDEVYHIDFLDFGNAYVFRDGVAIPARWNRMERDQPLLLTALDGTPIYMRPGRTFYQVMGTTSPYTQNGTEWRFVFKTP